MGGTGPTSRQIGSCSVMGADRPDPENGAPPKRQYPAAYERAVPIVLALVALAILVLLGIILVVALGLYPGA